MFYTDDQPPGDVEQEVQAVRDDTVMTEMTTTVLPEIKVEQFDVATPVEPTLTVSVPQAPVEDVKTKKGTANNKNNKSSVTSFCVLILKMMLVNLVFI